MDSIVFKVKYEDTLRRFNVAVSDVQRLDLSMEGLRLKVCSLFNLHPEADFRLTYEDEDGDLVTLGDDEDLYDVVRQGLNPVRITTLLNSVMSDQTGARASESFTPSQPPAQNVQPNSSNVTEVLKSIQEPLCHFLQKLGLSSQNAQQSTNPDVVETQKAVKKLALDLSISLSKAPCVSPFLAELLDGVSKLGHSGLIASHSESGDVNVSCHNEVGNDSKSNSDARPVEASVTEGVKNDDTGRPHPLQSADKSTNSTEGATPVRSPLSSHFSGIMATSYREPIPQTENPFLGLMSAYERYLPSRRCKYLPKRMLKKDHGFGSIIHKGVSCDGCGVLPITGPRFKSKVKYDFDLCSSCFCQMGNDADYTRIDFPLPYRHSRSYKTTEPVIRLPRPHGVKHHRSRLDSRFIMDVTIIDGTMMPPSTPFTKIWRMSNNGTLPWTSGSKLLWIGGDRFSPSDSVEIEVPLNGVPVGNELDIAVDFIAPELPGRYISYWKMAEPSGHKFGQRVWVLVQVDAFTDLTRDSTPTLNLNLPPDYINQGDDVNADLKLFLGSGDASALQKDDKTEIGDTMFPTNDELLVASDFLWCTSSAAASPSAPSAAFPNIPVSLLGASISDPIVHETHNNSTSAPEASFSVSIIDTGETSGTSSNIKDIETKLNANGKAEQAAEKRVIEAKLQKELEQMGFKQIEQNKEVLRMNEYDLEQSVEDLCSVSEWDPILEELKEMGFEDKETNKVLLEKNNGSITRVVMDLIAEEKA